MTRHLWRRVAAMGALLVLALPAASAPDQRAGLPAAPPGVADLRFDEFFRLPAGRTGLDPGERLLELAGQRVRVLGYVVGEEEPTPGLFMLTARPVALAELADGPADDLPPATLSFHLAGLARAGLARSRQDGRFVIYSASFERMNDLVAFLTTNCCGGASCAPQACQPETDKGERHETTARARRRA